VVAVTRVTLVRDPIVSKLVAFNNEVLPASAFISINKFDL